MKKSIKVFAVVLAVVMLCLSLASCDLFGKKLDGKFVADHGMWGEVTMRFDGDDVKVTYKTLLGQITEEGTYEIKDDEITITILDEDGEVDDDANFDGTYSFEETKDGDIIIDGVIYEKAE